MYYGMQTNGSVWDRPVPQHWTTHYFQEQMAAPAHEYDDPPSGRPVQTMGLGVTFGDLMRSPAFAATRVARGEGIRGLGQPEGEVPALAGGAALVIVAGILVIGGILSYQAGKAMAPRSSDEKLWGWIGVPVGLLTGTLGLGIMGIVSNRSK